MKTALLPEVAAIETTLEAMEAGNYKVPVTPGVTEMIQLVFCVPYMGKQAIAKVRVSRQMIESNPYWKEMTGRTAAESIRDLNA